MVYSIIPDAISLHSKTIQQNRENSRYLNWYCNVNFWGNMNTTMDFSYDNVGLGLQSACTN